jgi:hypothetical protein
MKSKIIIIVFSAILYCLTSCGSRSANNHAHENGAAHSPNTHVHADGTVHEGATHSDSENTMPVQESFKVEADSSAINHNHGHSH